jgi:hypothetical protein
MARTGATPRRTSLNPERDEHDESGEQAAHLGTLFSRPYRPLMTNLAWPNANGIVPTAVAIGGWPVLLIDAAAVG